VARKIVIAIQVKEEIYMDLTIMSQSELKTKLSQDIKDPKNKKVVLGQFYTSDQIADFMINLSTKSKDTMVLDSGFGEGVFIKSLIKNGFSNIKGCDIDERNYKIAIAKFANSADLNCIDYLETPRGEKFDLIIGNPPYVKWNNIQHKVRDKLISDSFWKKYSNGEWDLLYAFIIWSIEKLEENGELIYIVPYNWFNSTYASSLRKYLIDNGQFEIICHFGEFKLFGDCYPNNIIFRYRKTQNKNKPLIFVSEFKGKKGNISNLLNYIKNEFDKIDHKEYVSENEYFKIFTTDQFETENLWHLATPLERDYIFTVEKSCKNFKVGDYLNVGVGIVSGFDKAYFLKEWQLDQLSGVEKKLILPFIKAKNCERYIIKNGSHYIFADEIKSEDEFKVYPQIYQRLLKHKDKLKNRYNVKIETWWHWATIRNKNLFERNLDRPKIFVPCVDRSLKARYSYTDKQYFGSGDVLIITNKNELREDLKYILAWLNSEVVNKWYRIKGSHTGHRIRYTQSYVSQIPLRLIDWNNPKEIDIYNEVLNKVDSVIKDKKNNNLEKDIDNLFEQLITN